MQNHAGACYCGLQVYKLWVSWVVFAKAVCKGCSVGGEPVISPWLLVKLSVVALELLCRDMMPPEHEQLMRGVNSMAEIRELQKKQPGFKESYLDAVARPTACLAGRFSRLTWTEEKVGAATDTKCLGGLPILCLLGYVVDAG